jgi:hypothetical protein
MTARERRRRDNELAARPWAGKYRPYDLIKEATIAFAVVAALSIVLTILFSSPDDPPSTLKTWSRTDPVDFVTTAITELDGTSGLATYGPPYNHNGDGQNLAFLRPQKWLGVSHPINTAQDFVIQPLRAIPNSPLVQTAVSLYQTSPAKLQSTWTGAYEKGVANAKPSGTGGVTLPAGNYGPVAVMMNGLLNFAQSGGLDGALLTSRQFYNTDYTKPLLFMADGAVLSNRAQAEHLLGEQWGMMNETGSYPGQVWLWLYTLWYQIKPFSNPNSVFGMNADIYVMAIMTILSLLFILVPVLPFIRGIPRKIPIYKLIWRDHYRERSD